MVQTKDGEQKTLPYDKLILGTGSTPRSLPIPGKELANVFTVTTLEQAIRVKEQISSGKTGSAVIVGGGLIGLEMAEALADMWGIETTIVEMADQIMPGFLSPALAKIAHRHLAERDVALYTSETLRAIEGENGQAVADRKSVV